MQERKNKPGRPPSSNPRSVGLGFKATPAEAAQLRELAAAHCMTLSVFVRERALGGKPPSLGERAEFLALSRFGNVLNQFLVQSYTGNMVEDPEAIVGVLNEILEVHQSILDLISLGER